MRTRAHDGDPLVTLAGWRLRHLHMSHRGRPALTYHRCANAKQSLSVAHQNGNYCPKGNWQESWWGCLIIDGSGLKGFKDWITFPSSTDRYFRWMTKQPNYTARLPASSLWRHLGCTSAVGFQGGSPHLIWIGAEKGTDGNLFCTRQRVFFEAAQLLFEGWPLNSRVPWDKHLIEREVFCFWLVRVLRCNLAFFPNVAHKCVSRCMQAQSSAGKVPQ